MISIFKWSLILSTLLAAYTYFYKDEMPAPEYYQSISLPAPLQTSTQRKPFSVSVNDQQYNITPKYDYTLRGVVVSYSDADKIGNIYHYSMWKDFLNIKDLCVIWGENVSSGVYQNMQFENRIWTCWASWPDSETGRRFTMSELSNNHLLSVTEEVNKVLMEVEPGDTISIKGVLANYANPASNFTRDTSTSRDDNGNGACETIFVDKFEILDKANAEIRSLHTVAKTIAIVSLIGFIVLFIAAPVGRRG